jgi:hypothetical protein
VAVLSGGRVAHVHGQDRAVAVLAQVARVLGLVGSWVVPFFILVSFASGSCELSQSSLDALLFRLRSNWAKSSRVGAGMPLPLASGVRNRW